MMGMLELLGLVISILLSVGMGRSSSALGGVIYAAAPLERGAFHVGGKGVYNYGYNTGDGIAKVEVRHSDGSVTGSYRYFDPLGRQIVRSYIADKRGFRVLGNELPVAPNSPAIGIPEAQTLIGAVEGTQEFNSPNVVTQDDTNLLQSNFDQQNENYLAQQRQALEEQKQNLERLKLQNDIYIKQQEHQIQKLQDIQQRSLKQSPKYSTFYSTLTNNLDSRYFYSPDNIKYDFPAGFAYHTIPQRVFLKPIGVTGTQEKLLLTAGHTSSRSTKFPEVSFRPVYKKKIFRRPYIIGHAK